MNITELQKEILQIKEEKDVCILAHSYVAREIAEVADFVGDSYALSVKAKGVENQTLIMCGVRFMAETAKMLSPEKNVYLANETAGCPMAEQMSKEYIQSIKDKHPDYAVVAYINTTADLKTVCDVCVTSSSAVDIVSKMPEKNILFIPDCNLGGYVKEKLPEKNIMLLDGGCPVHAKITADEVMAAKSAHPNALFLVHPECKREVVELADFIGSTAEIMDFAKQSDSKEFIIGTENSIREHLQLDCPDKKFYPLSKRLVCSDMKAVTLMDLYNCLNGKGGEEILLDEQTIKDACRCIDKMINM